MKMMQFFKIRSIRKGRNNREKGQVFAIVLVVLLLVCAIIVSTLTVVGATMKTNIIYINNTTSLYSAETGIQDGIWNVMNQTSGDLTDGLLNINTSLSSLQRAYSDYDYNTEAWLYHLTDPISGNTTPININTYPVDITVKNKWVPLIDAIQTSWVPTINDLSPNTDGTITAPSLSDVTSITNDKNLVISGVVATPGLYKVVIYYKDTSPSTPLTITSIGCWLPQGFTYNNGSSTLQGICSPEQAPLSCAGNQAVVWPFSSGIKFSDLADDLGYHGLNTISFYFNYTMSNSSKPYPDALTWITVTPNKAVGMDTNGGFAYPYTWNNAVKVYNLISDAGNTEIEAYIPKSGTRALGSAMAGDYVATGNSLLTMASYNSNDVRTNLLSQSSATVADIPSDADLQGAYLYWTGWYYISSFPASAYPSVNFKVNGTQVYFDAGGHPATGGNIGVFSTNSQNKWNGPSGSGYSYSCYRDVTDLVRSVLHDTNPTNIPGNATYSVGPATSYHMADTGGTYQEWAYAGWSLVLIYTGPTTLGHQLYLYDTFTYADNVKDIDITGNTAGPGGNITGFLVPPQLPQEIGDPNSIAAKITACVGDGDFCYDSDFIAINAPSTYWSNPWTIPANSVYRLWDGITLPSPYTYMNTPTNKNNVWNSYSQSGLSEGVDIKTFNITWASGLVHTGDTSARIDVPTSTDSWSFIYMIVSVRSSVTSGGSISYLIRKRPP